MVRTNAGTVRRGAGNLAVLDVAGDGKSELGGAGTSPYGAENVAVTNRLATLSNRNGSSKGGAGNPAAGDQRDKENVNTKRKH